MARPWLTLVVVLLAAGCEFGASQLPAAPDARRVIIDDARPPSDATVAPPDAPVAPPDAPIAPPDAPIALPPDASPPDAPVAEPDAPIAPPDASPPDAPIAQPDAPPPDAPVAEPDAPPPPPVDAARPDAAPPDASPPDAPPLGVSCGDALCDPGDFCCIKSTGHRTTFACQASASCPSGVSYQCDGPEDCNGGVCCDVGGGSRCVAGACGGEALCHGDGDCVPGAAACCPSTPYPICASTCP